MKHFGDICKIKGSEVPLVDIVTGGSPCQDLSVAGKRAGLQHSALGDGETTRSGLFMEQIRLIKEMREYDKATNGRSDKYVRPRYMVWENVCGAFSSNNGEDFRAVLEETAKVVQQDAIIPGLAKGQKWSKSGAILGDGWSIAWRVHDAQFWGVPQRRKRISLIADFGGETAPKILFECKSEFRDTEQSREERKDTSTTIETSIGESSSNCLNSWDFQSKHIQSVDGVAETLYSGEKVWGGGTSFVLDENRSEDKMICNSDPNNPEIVGSLCADDWRGANSQYVEAGKLIAFRKTSHPQNAEQGQGWEETDTNDTLNVTDNSESRTPTLVVDQGAGKSGCNVSVETTPTLTTTHGGEPVVFENHAQDSRFRELGDICQTVSATYGTGGNNQPLVVKQEPICMAHAAAMMASCDNGVAYSLNASDYKEPPTIAMAVENHGIDSRVTIREDGSINQSLPSCMEHDPGNGGLVFTTFTQNQREEVRDLNDVAGSLSTDTSTHQSTLVSTVESDVTYKSLVRRLTPLECTRLQGFPDGWVDIGEWTDTQGKVHKDSDTPKYKALGNSIALPFWEWMAKRMVQYFPVNYKPTMASLFDGIGGFPLSYYKAGCIPVWASEIEDYPIAVCKKHFGDEDNNIPGDLEKFL